jgi:hypothetical protein
MSKGKKKSDAKSALVEGQNLQVKAKPPTATAGKIPTGGEEHEAGIDPFLTLVFGLVVGAVIAVVAIV